MVFQGSSVGVETKWNQHRHSVHHCLAFDLSLVTHSLPCLSLARCFKQNWSLFFFAFFLQLRVEYCLVFISFIWFLICLLEHKFQWVLMVKVILHFLLTCDGILECIGLGVNFIQGWKAWWHSKDPLPLHSLVKLTQDWKIISVPKHFYFISAMCVPWSHTDTVFSTSRFSQARRPDKILRICVSPRS